MDAHNGGLEAQNGALEGLWTNDGPHWSEKMDPDQHLVMGIRNPAYTFPTLTYTFLTMSYTFPDPYLHLPDPDLQLPPNWKKLYPLTYALVN